MEEKEGGYIPPEREKQVGQLAKSISKEEDDIPAGEFSVEEMDKEKKLAGSMLPKKRRHLYQRIV